MLTNLLCCTSTMESGGSERQMVQLLQNLDRSQISPHLYLTYRLGPLLPQIPADVVVDSFASKDSSRYAVIPGAIFSLQIRKLRQVVRARKIQVTYDRLYHTVMLGAAALRRLPVARVVTVVSPPSEDFGKSRQRWMRIKRRILSWSYASATRLLAVSEESADDAAHFYKIPRERWTIVPSPIDFAKIQANAQSQPPPQFHSHDGVNIAVVGRLSQEKNHQLLLKLVSRFKSSSEQVQPRVHLHVVGDGVLRPDLERFATEQGIAPDITFYGIQANPHAIVSRCDCLCLPSLYEGFPNVVMEAISCGTPVFASNRAGGLQRLLGNNERGLLLDPNDLTAWCKAIEEFSEDRSKAVTKLEAAKDYVLRHHDLPRWVRTMEEIFVEAAANR